jgi:hypothetical protein
MSLFARIGRECRSLRFAIYLLAIVLLAGCGHGTHAGGQADDSDFLKHENFQKDPIAKFAGTVTIDGQPPRKDCTMFVILTDPKHLDENGRGQLPKHFAACNAEGKFAFSTYGVFDGVAAGKYVATFMELHNFAQGGGGGKAGLGALKASGPSTQGPGHSYGQPDELKNLFSDPDKNVAVERFVLQLTPPGQEDYHFDLAVAGKEPAKHSPHALGAMSPRHLDIPPDSSTAKK